MVEVARKIENLFNINIPIILSSVEEQGHSSCTRCNICNTKFTLSNHKVANHNHLSGRFRQTLWNTCNLKLQIPRFVPVFLHNLLNYYAHFIITELGYYKNAINVIPNTEKKFISFSKYVSNNFTIRFIDSCRFMPSKLLTLAENLMTPDFKKFWETAKKFYFENLPLVTRKGVYSYDYTDRWSKLDETELPPKEQFYSTLTEEHIACSWSMEPLSLWDFRRI
jgi:hypothetical protein